MTVFSKSSTNPNSVPRTTVKVLVADTISGNGVQAIQDLGCEVMYEPDLACKDLAKRLAQTQAEVLVVRETAVNEAAVEASPKLALVVQAGAGVDEIDIGAASRRGVFVANCPGRNANAVAELAWAHILACDRRLPDQVIEMRAGQWKRKEFLQAAGLHGRTLGVIGLGQVGMEIARRAKSFGMSVVAWSRQLTEDKADAAGVHFCANIVNLAKLADVVSVSLAVHEETDLLIGEKFLNAMKPNSIFVNTSSGRVVDEGALAAAVRGRGIRAGLDVFAHEPDTDDAKFEEAIVKVPGVYGTFHVGASTTQAAHAVTAETVRVIREWLESGSAPNCVNRARSTPATTLLSVRHLNRPGVLAHVFYTLGQAGINAEEMENIIYEGGEAALARIHLNQTPTQEQMNTILRNANVLSASITSIMRKS